MATTTNFSWETPDDTDLVKDGAAAIRTLGSSIDTSFVDLKGGTTGQVLAKASGTDLDFSWVAQDDSNAIQNAIVDAKGDLIAATAADTPARLAVGTNGQVLTADSTTATGLAWASASGSSGPAFSAYASTDQSGITASTYTKVTYSTEEFDTDGNFASSRFTPTKSGKYQCSVTGLSYDGGNVYLEWWKNGANVKRAGYAPNPSGLEWYFGDSLLIDMNGSSDYLEIYVYMSGGSTRRMYGGSSVSRFAATWIRS